MISAALFLTCLVLSSAQGKSYYCMFFCRQIVLLHVTVQHFIKYVFVAKSCYFIAILYFGVGKSCYVVAILHSFVGYVRSVALVL